MKIKGYTKWFRYLLPATMPYSITGAITATGGAWNTSIICEYINWGEDSTIVAYGIGGYISSQYNVAGNNTMNIAMSIIIMSIIIIFINKLIWRKLYLYTKRYSPENKLF